MQEKFEEIKIKAREELKNVSSLKLLNDIKIKFVGKNGEVTSLLRGMKDISADKRSEFGKMVNDLKEEVNAYIEKKESELKEKELQARYEKESVDITLPAKEEKSGSTHPLTPVKNQIIDAFPGMGFEVFEGPEIDSD